MDNMIQLNLRSDSEKAAAENLPNPQDKEPETPAVNSKRLNRFLRKAAHKASAEYGRSGKGDIFAK